MDEYKCMTYYKCEDVSWQCIVVSPYPEHACAQASAPATVGKSLVFQGDNTDLYKLESKASKLPLSPHATVSALEIAGLAVAHGWED